MAPAGALPGNYLDASTQVTRNTDGSVRTRYTLTVNGGTQLLAPAGDGTWRRDVSQGYFAVSTASDGWTGVDAVGTRYKFTCIGGATCTRWYLTQVTDPDQNVTLLDYFNETFTGGNGAALLSGIRYNFIGSPSTTNPLHQVTLHYDPSPTPEVQAFGGSLVTHNQLLTGVKIERAGTKLGSWTLSYSASRDTSRQRLDSIQAYDRTNPGAPLGIPATFTYETNVAADGSIRPFDSGIPFDVNVILDSTNPNYHLTNATSLQCQRWVGFARGGVPCYVQDLAALIDIDGDGLPDLVWGGEDNGSGDPGLRWARNISAGTDAAPVFSDVTMLTGSQSWHGVVSANNADGSNSYITGNKAMTRTLLMDMNGDGVPDLVSSPGGYMCPNNRVNSIAVQMFHKESYSYDPDTSATCFDATAPLAEFRRLYEPFASYMPLVYTQTGPAQGGASPLWVQVKLADFTGDGVPDMIIADNVAKVWHVYPGYRISAGSWAFSPNYLTVTPKLLADSTVGVPIQQIYSRRLGMTVGGEVSIEFRDLNGDGLPDRMLEKTWTDAAGASHTSWYAEYNTGTDFVQLQPTGKPQAGMIQMDATIGGTTYGNISSHDSALLDLNRDGRPDFVSRTHRCSNSDESLDISYSAGLAGFNSPNLWNLLPAGTCVANPTGKVPLQPYSDAEKLIDINGDGILDLVRTKPFDEPGPGRWVYYRPHHQARRSDLLIGATSSSGLSLSFNWAASTSYGSLTGVPRINDVVSSITQSGPGMDPLTTSYSYLNPQVGVQWDDPTGSQPEYLGFAKRFETPSVPALTIETNFGPTHATAGQVMEVCRLTATSTTCAGASDEDIQYTWATSNIGSCGSGTCYPLYSYVQAINRFRSGFGANAISTVSNGAPDAYGNILTTSTVGETLSSGSTSVNSTRVFATGAGSGCVSCVVEETLTNPAAASGTDSILAHAYYHYDLPAGATSNARDASTVPSGHLSYVEALVSSSPDVYEIPQLSYYGATGLLSNVVKSYQGQALSKLTETYNYDTNGYDLLSRTASDDLSNALTVNYKWSAAGDLLEVDGPSAATPATGLTLARAYDSVGRVIAESNQPITGNTIASPLRAYEYVTPTATTLAAIKSYTFAAQPVPFTAGAVPQTDDSTLTIRYLDALGRAVQGRTRLGSGTAASSAASNVVKSLPQQYSVDFNYRYDGAGRLVTSLEPYFSNTGSFVDPRTPTELSTPGLHAKTVTYDYLGRPSCTLFTPVSGALPTPGDAFTCISTYSENSTYKRATRTSYLVLTDSTLDGTRAYEQVRIHDSSASATSNPALVYLDALGRPRHSVSPSGATDQQTTYDPVGRLLATTRTAPSGNPVTVSWTYDKRGRVTSVADDASGSHYNSYLPTGELWKTIQNATASTSDQKAVWSTLRFGTLGRVIERHDFRWQQSGTCGWATVEDMTIFSYDNAYGGQAGRYQNLAGHLAWITTTTPNTAIALSYDNLGRPVLRDEFTSDGLQHSIADTRGADGRLLTRSMTSPYLAGFNSLSTFGYAIGYDSAGRPQQINPTYDAAGVFHPISASSAPSAYWLAGTGSSASDPTTGPYDALNRLVAEKWDAAAITKSQTFLPGSNLPGSYGTTLTASGTNVFSSQAMTWQGTLLGGQTVTSNWDAAGTAHAAAYDADAHLMQWSAAPAQSGSTGPASQQFNEGYAFTLDNLKTVNSTTSLNSNVAATYNYDATSRERVNSITVPSAPVGDYFSYDRRGRGLVTQHRLSSAQSPPQDAYEYDSLNRLISISRLGAKVEDLAYDGAGDLVSRQFAAEVRYYVGDNLSLVLRNTGTKVGYAHVTLGGERIASFWVKSSGSTNTNGVIYYHRNNRSDVVATTTAGGQMGIGYRYLPSGAIDKTVGTEADENMSELGFIGGLKLSNGLVHLKARAYSPALRRFLQPDTLDLRRYTYAHGDPLNFVDPSGRDGVETPCPTCKRPEERPGFNVPDPFTAVAMGIGAAIDALASAASAVGSFLGSRSLCSGCVGADLAAATGGTSGLSGWTGGDLGGGSGNGQSSVGAPVGSGNGGDHGSVNPATGSVAAGAAFIRSLVSQEMMSEVGKGIAGAGTRRVIDDLPELIGKYGGKANDWVKMTSRQFRWGPGPYEAFETHWYERLSTGERFEMKTKFPQAAGIRGFLIFLLNLGGTLTTPLIILDPNVVAPPLPGVCPPPCRA